MWLVVNISGKQEIIRINQQLDIDNVRANSFDIMILNRVMLAVKDSNNVEIGRPFLNIKVHAIIIQNFFGKKILVLRFKRKKHYKKVQGFRAKKTRILIKNII